MNNSTPKKLHAGCGTVYLEGYINVDLPIPGVSFQASKRPDLVRENLTTINNYYKNPVTKKDIENRQLQERKIVVDLFADVRKLPFLANTLDEIRSVQLFEHFTYEEGEQVLQHWHNLLKSGGLLHIDVPDLDETIKAYLKTKSKREKRWHLRLIFGSQKNEHSFHKALYSKNMLASLLRKHGFYKIRDVGNIHFYPAFDLEAVKR